MQLPTGMIALLVAIAASTAPVRLASELIATLDADTRTRIVFAFDAAERKQWGRSPAERPGLRAGEMTPRQLGLLGGLLQTVLSSAGYSKASAVMAEQDLLGRNESGMGAEYFWLAFYGTPGSETPWAWRFGGHHLSLHVTLDGDTIRSVTPAFFGTDAAWGADDPRGEHYNLLASRTDAGRRLARALDAEQRGEARLAGSPSDHVISEGKDGYFAGNKGISADRLTSEQQKLLFELVKSYTADMQRDLAATRLEAIRETPLNKIRFVWVGDLSKTESAVPVVPEAPEAIEQPDGRFNLNATPDPAPQVDPPGPYYFRVQGPTFLFECWSSGRHVHTIWRNTTDFGG